MRLLKAAVLLPLTVLLAGCAATSTSTGGAPGSATGPSSGSGGGVVVPGPTGSGGSPGMAGPGSGSAGAPGTGAVPTAPAPTVPAPLAQCPGTISFAAGQSGATPLPVTAEVVAVTRCIVRTAADGTRTAVTQRATDNLAPLVAALRLPRQTAAGLMCPMYAIALPSFQLVLKDGKTLVPLVPTTGCGQPRPEVLAALGALRYLDTGSRPLR